MNKVFRCNSLQDIGQTLSSDRLVADVWMDIQMACTHGGEGVKKQQGSVEREQALARAIEILSVKFPNPAAFRNCITESTFPSHIDVQTLYHFAGLWEQREAVRSIAHNQQYSTAYEIREALHGKGRGARSLTPEEHAELRHRRNQRKDARAELQNKPSSK